MTVLEQLAAFCVEAKVATLSAEERDIQARHFADAIIAALVGARGEEIRAMAGLYEASAGDRMAALAATIRMTEIDDIHMPSCTTPSSAIAPLVLTLARTEPSSAPRALDALRVGMDLMVRFGTAVEGPNILYREIWPTYLAAPLACAGAAARMLGFDAGKTAHALAIALTLTAGGSGRFRQGLSPRWYMHGCAVEAGYRAARAAQAGFCGDLNLLEREWLGNTHGAPLNREILLQGLGETSSYRDLSIKPWCSAKQAIAATEIFRAMLRDGLKPEDIHSIVVRVPPAYADMIAAEANPSSRSTTFASIRYQLAVAAYNPDVLYDICRTEIFWTDAIVALMQRISIEKDESLQAHYPKRWPATLVVQTSAGTREETLLDAPGDPGRRFTDADLDDKSKRVLDPLNGEGSAVRWLAAARAATEDLTRLPMLATDLDRALAL